MRRISSAVLLCLLARAAGAASLHIPVQLPPHLLEEPAEAGPTAWFGGGYGFAQGPGLSLSGPGALWELAWAVGDDLTLGVHSGGYLLKGELDPFGRGRRASSGGAVLFETDAIWAPRGRASYRLYTGLQAHLTVLDVRDAAPIGAAAAEPGTAISPVLGVPFGVLLPLRLGGGWSAQWQADVSALPAGVTYFSYGPGGPSAYESRRRIDFNASAGTGLRLSRADWRLSVEALIRRSLGFGNNEPVTQGALLLVIGAL